MNINLTPQDHKLIQLLRHNARSSVTELAKAMHLSRTTVQQRLSRLEDRGVIQGYTVRLSPEAKARSISAHVMVKADSRDTSAMCQALAEIPQIDTVMSVSGRYDFIVIIRAVDTQQLDTVLDEMWEIDGITDTESSVVLSTKLDRR